MTATGMTAANPTAHETLRKADLDRIATLLESQRARTVDLSTQGRSLWVAGGNLIVQGVEPLVDADGVTDVNGQYAFGEIGMESLASRINRSRNDLKADHDHRTDLFDVIVGYHLRGELGGEPSPYTSPDGRIHTLRLLRADNSADNEVDGMVRAVLGGTYLAMDNLDVLASLMQGLYAAGVGPDTYKVEADLTESRMVIKVWAPELYALAPQAFGDYRSPFTGETVEQMPKVFAGIVFSNSEVGRGAWSIAPRLVYEACTNGTTITKDLFSKPHKGERRDGEGIVEWAADTQAAILNTMKLKTRDMVSTFLNVDYLRTKLDEMAKDAEVPTGTDHETVITKVTRHTGHQGSRMAILNLFRKGGQFTAGGVMQAYTAAAQLTQSGDLAYDLENRAVDAMSWVASQAR